MVSEDKDEKRGLFSIFGGSSAEEKSRLWLPFVFLFLFLAAGGFYAWYVMKGAAHKLAGGDSYTQLSANSAGYGAPSSVAKEENFFASDEELSSVPGKKAEKAGLEAVLARAGAAGASGGAHGGTAYGGEESVIQEAGAAAYSGGGVLSSALQSKLRARESVLAGMKGGQTSKSTAFNEESGVEKPSVGVAVASSEKTFSGQAPKKGPGKSVMESLKSAFKSSIYGARLTSQDAASAWIAKSFTAAPEEELALQYDDKMRSKLDKVNPSSIPRFLRDQDINATEAKTLGISKVGKPDVDKEATKEALKEDKDYQAKKAVQEMSNGVINPMFSGFSGGGAPEAPIGADQTSDDEYVDDPDFDPYADTVWDEDDKYMYDPDSDPDLDVMLDEDGNTIIRGNNGLKYIFGSDGAILGCEDTNAGMCLMPGADSCPSGLLFT